MRKPMETWVPWIGIAAVVVVVAASVLRERPRPVRSPLGLIGSAQAPVLDREGLENRLATMEARIAADDEDHAARIVLAELLVRQARVTGNAVHAARAEQRLREVLAADPGDYDAQRSLGVVLLSLHRFEEAIAAGDRARAMRPDDAFNEGVVGDGLLELGRYDEAFAAFQRMVDKRPNAASYARASYALELQGRLDEALDAMRRAVHATSPRDAEGLAWTLAHAGGLLFALGRVDEAEAQYRLAAKAFADHPLAQVGQARIQAHRGRDAEALSIAEPLLRRAPSVALAAFIGDLHARGGRHGEAARFYATAEAIGREAVSGDESLAGFLAERGLKLQDALRLAERAANRRHDVPTLDALAWAYFRNGRLQEADAAAAQALATGTRDKRVVLHAAAIKSALGDASAARLLTRRAVAVDADFDVLASGYVVRSIEMPGSGGLMPSELRASR